MLDKKLNWFQLSQRQNLSPFPNYFSTESICREMKKVIGRAYEQVVLIFQNKHMYVFMDKDNHEKVGKFIMKKVLAEPDIFIKLATRQRNFYKEFYYFLNKNNKSKDLVKFSDKKLIKLHQEFERRYKEIYSHYFPVLAMEIYFFNYLRDYINSLEKNKVKVARCLDILITERASMINTVEKIETLKICSLIKKNNKWLKILKSENLENIKKEKLLYKPIKRHERKFFWITRDYDADVLIFSDFVSRFNEHLKKDPEKELSKIFQAEESLKKNVNDIYKKLKVDKKHQRLFQAMREGIYYKELRKWIVSKALYYYDPILKEIAKRGHISLKQARHLMTRDLENLLVKKKDLSSELNQRIDLSIFHCFPKRTLLYTQKKAHKYFNFFVKVDYGKKILNGMPVSAGKANGRVKIVIGEKDFFKVKKGDVITTLQVTPVFSPILSKASALICDGGPGITSHPATLAREAGIPGVIGLRMATKIFKDGDLVEVDGNNGVVKKLS